MKLHPVPPYDFDLSAGIFTSGGKDIRIYTGGEFRQVLRLKDKLALVRVTSSGSVDRPELTVNWESSRPLEKDDELLVRERITSIFSLPLDLEPFYSVARQDPVLAVLVRRLRGLKSPVTTTPFEALVDSIIEQQISLNVAYRLENNLIRMAGEHLAINGQDYYAYPTPDKLASMTIEELRQPGLTLRKAEYLKGISGLVARGELDLEKFKNYADIRRAIQELDAVRGIGVWTAEMTLVRGMGRLEALPADDIGLRRIIAHYYFEDHRISAIEARQTAERWGVWKGLASFYLVIAEMLKISI